MYGNNTNPYVRPFNNMISQQSMYEQIDNEINNLQQMRERMKNSQMQQNQPQQQPTSINQTFQLAPTNRDVIRYANSYEEVQREMVMGEHYSRYEEGRQYGAKEDSMRSLKYMLESMENFARMLKEEATSQEEVQMIRQTAQKIAQM